MIKKSRAGKSVLALWFGFMAVYALAGDLSEGYQGAVFKDTVFAVDEVPPGVIQIAHREADRYVLSSDKTFEDRRADTPRNREHPDDDVWYPNSGNCMNCDSGVRDFNRWYFRQHRKYNHPKPSRPRKEYLMMPPKK